MDIELLMDELGRAGVTILLKVDHERSQEWLGKPWTLVMFGPALGHENLVRTDAKSLRECLDLCFRELRKMPGDWGWLDAFD